jgi:phosphomannomutase/phosphoglucomutase
MEKFCNHAQFDEAKLITIDGLRVEFEDGWGLLRASNTSPCLVARFEAKDEISLDEIMLRFKSQIATIDKHLLVSF